METRFSLTFIFSANRSQN